MYDVIIIGAGVTGSAIARELSRYRLKICVLEKEEDVCSGTSKANSGIVHAGFDAQPGSLKARMNREGNQRMEPLCKDLDVPFRRNGSLVLCFQQEDVARLEALRENGVKNGVEGLRLVSGEAMRALEPNLSEEAVAALYAPTGGIVCPFELTLALAENAQENGVKFSFDTQVQWIEKQEAGFYLQTSRGALFSRTVVNAAGVYGDELHNLVSEHKLTITPRKGEYCLLDKQVGCFVDKTVFPLPTALGKGVLLTPTVHGNLLVGPNAVDLADKENTATTLSGIAEVVEKAKISARAIPIHRVITAFAGLRAHEEGDDFILGEAPDVAGFYDAVGIESPGLTSAPAIGRLVAEQVRTRLCAEEKLEFIGRRKGITPVFRLDKEKLELKIRENPAYGNIICRCEQVTEGQILEAIHRPLGARSLDGLKRRIRAGMGRCQGGFCTPKMVEILARELDLSPWEVTKAGNGSEILKK